MFHDLSDAHRDVLVNFGTSRRYAKGTLLINEGDAPGSLYMVESGRVRVFVGDESGREVTLCELGPGHFFGEMALIDEAPRSASAITLEPCQLVCVAQPDFERCLSENGDLALDIARLMARRVRGLTTAVRDLALLDVCGRVENTLRQLAEQREDGRCIVSPVPTQAALAQRVGASREMVSKVMKTLYLAGTIERCPAGLRVERRGCRG